MNAFADAVAEGIELAGRTPAESLADESRAVNQPKKKRSWQDEEKARRRRKALAETFRVAGEQEMKRVKREMDALWGSGDATVEKEPRPGDAGALFPQEYHAPFPLLPSELKKDKDLAERLLRMAGQIDRCGEFYVSVACGGCGIEVPSEKGLVPAYCRNRGCPRCEGIRASEMKRFIPLLTRHATNRLRFMTLTVPNIRSLEGMTENGKPYNAMKLLSKMFKRLREFLKATRYCRECHGFEPRRGLTRGTCECVARPRDRWRKIKLGGTLRSLEVTYSSRTGWHPHVHAIVDVPFVDQRLLAEAWVLITGRMWPAGPANLMGVDAREIKGSIEEAAKELLKYPTKLTDLEGKPWVASQWVRAMKGVRCVQATGAWLGLQAKLEEEAKEEQPLPELLEKACPCCGLWAWKRVLLPLHPDLQGKKTACDEGG